MHQETTSTFSVLRMLWDLVRPYRSRSYKILFWIIVNQVTNLVEPAILMLLVDHLVKQQQTSQPDKSRFILMCGAALLAYTLISIAMRVKNQVTFKVANEIELDIKAESMSKLLHTPIFIHQTDNSGKLMGTMRRGVEKTIETIWASVFETLPLVVTSITVIITLAFAYRPAAIILIPFMISFVLILRWSKHRTKPLLKLVADLNETSDAKATEVLDNILTVQAFNQERHEHLELSRLWGEQCAADNKTELQQSKYSFVSGFVLTAGRLSVVGLCGWSVLSREMSVGELLFVTQIVSQIFNAAQSFGRIHDHLARAEEPIRRTLELMRTEHKPENASRSGLARPNGYIKCEKVGFHHHDNNSLVSRCDGRSQKAALSEVSFQTEVGMLVGVVGLSGSGKTTLLNLLMGFDCPTKGYIEIDGVDMKDFSTESLRSHMGYVPSKIELHNTTVAKNICYGMQNATRDEIIEAAKQAGAHEFIEELPQGYETVIGNHGSKLSAGQQQRICLARALILKPAILVLDEATMHLDTENAWGIKATIDDLRGKCTIIHATHQLWQVTDADLILVIDNGKLAEKGTHRSLMARRGFYHYMYQKQALLQLSLSGAGASLN